ncbi:MAG: hypothetical protein ABI700_30110 [Chloroflexota bacterium]
MLIVVAIIGIIASLAIPALQQARRSANESSAIGNLRVVFPAQVDFLMGDFDEDGLMDYAADLPELFRAGLINERLAAGRASGYCYKLFSHAPSTWHMHADPLIRGVTGNRSFYIDEIGVMRFKTTSPAGPNSEPMDEFVDLPSTDHQDGEPPSCNRGEGAPTIDERMSHFLAQTLAKVSKFISDDLLSQALGAAKSQKVQRLVLMAMDVNQDGALNFTETLHVDVLNLARQLTKEVIFDNPPQDEVLGKDHHVTKATDWFLNKVEQSLHLGAANEEDLTNVPIEEMLGAKPPGDQFPP